MVGSHSVILYPIPLRQVLSSGNWPGGQDVPPASASRRARVASMHSDAQFFMWVFLVPRQPQKALSPTEPSHQAP